MDTSVHFFHFFFTEIFLDLPNLLDLGNYLLPRVYCPVTDLPYL